MGCARADRGVCVGLSSVARGSLRGIRGSPMGYPWVARGLPVRCTGGTHGFSVGRSWVVRGSLVGCLRVARGSRMVCV